jgi:sulfite oxidase
MNRIRLLESLLRRAGAAPDPRRALRAFAGTGAGAAAADAAAAAPARLRWLAAAAATLGAGLGYQLLPLGGPHGGGGDPGAGAARCSAPPVVDASGLPEYDREEVARHRSKEDRVWVTYKDGVYDVTEWLDQHPGGAARVMLAAGSAVDPFWALYAQHGTAQVRDILEGYRIGRLKGGAAPAQGVDPYANEPTDRLPALQVRPGPPLLGG